jgi:glycosyltransferase involved in cell wall biosynthesis
MLVGPELSRTDFMEEAARRGITTKLVDWTHRRSRLHNIRAAWRTWRDVKARLVHFNISWHPDMWIVALIARLLSGGKLLGSMRAMPDPHQIVPRRKYLGFIPGLRLWHLPELLVGWIWGRVLHWTVTVNARDFAARLVRHYGYPSDRISVIYNGIDVNAPRVPRDTALALRSQAGAADDDLLVAFVGRVSEEKGVHLLVEALAPMSRSVRLVVVGDGPQLRELRELVARLDADSRVFFCGYDAHPERWMAAADVVAVPSTWYEAFGRVVVEALNQGTPVLASRVGGMAELFDDGIHGRYVLSGSADAIRSALEDMLRDRSALAAAGRRGAELVRQKYSLERVEQDYAREYDRMRDLIFPLTPESAPLGRPGVR